MSSLRPSRFIPNRCQSRQMNSRQLSRPLVEKHTLTCFLSGVLQTLCDSRAVNKDVNSRWEQKVEKQIENMQERLLDKEEATKQRLDQKKKLQELAEKAQDDLEDVIGIPEEEDKLKEALKKQSQLRCVLNKKYTENAERERQLNEQQKLFAAKQQVVREKELALEGQRALDEFRKQHEAVGSFTTIHKSSTLSAGTFPILPTVHISHIIVVCTSFYLLDTTRVLV